MAEPVDAGQAAVHSNPVTQAGFAQIPMPVMLNRNLSAPAKLIYGYLKFIAWRRADETSPGRQQIMDDLGFSQNTVKEAIRALEGEGLLDQKRRGLGMTNLYVIHDPAEHPESAPSESDEAEHHDVKNLARAGSSVGVKTEVPRTATTTKYVVVAGDDDHFLTPPKIVKHGKQNLPLDALLAECCIDPASTLRVRQAVTALNGRPGAPGITHSFWVEVLRWDDEHSLTGDVPGELGGTVAARFHAEPAKYAEALARQIRVKVSLYRRSLPGATLTPTALSKWWLDLELRDDPGRPMTADEVRSLTPEQIKSL